MTGRSDHGTDKAPPRRRLPAAERRESILRAAAEVFTEAGYRAAKVSDVAARVGVTEPVIFQNFGSKAALFAAVVERAATDARASLSDLAASACPASGLLAHVLTAPVPGFPGTGPAGPAGPASHAGPGGYGAGAGHTSTAYGVLFADAAMLSAEPGLAGPARDAVNAVAGHLADLIRHAQAHGGVRPDANPDATAWLLLSLLSARRLRVAAMPASLEPAVTALVLRLLAPPAASQGTTRAEPP